MSAPRSFTSAKDAADRKTVTFDLDGTTFTARRPKDSMFLMLASTETSVADRIQLIPRFIDSCLPAAQREILAARLSDPDDDFDIDTLSDVFNFLVEELTGRPTSSPSDSTDGS